MGVISGNPDGTFRPGDPVNRAAMLKMLYLASGKTPASSSVGCFPDVQKGSWYESFVCDAATRGFVKGYVDRMFKPSRPVTRAEGLKMVMTVFELPAAATETPFTDVASDAWYAPFVAQGLKYDVLSAAEQQQAQFFPDEPLDRAGAAAYIWNATKVEASSSVSSAASSAASDATVPSGSSSSTRSTSSFDDTGASARVMNVNYPFSDTQSFVKKQPFSYRFSVTRPTFAAVTAKLREGSTGDLTCTLFRLEKDGLSNEYYLGYSDAGSCLLRTALAAGDYQLQLQPSVADTTYVVDTALGSGDGNDGFSQAMPLQFGRVRVDFLDSNDLEDWFKFTVTSQKEMTVSLTSADNLRCLIMPSDDVDLYGFQMPACNAAYDYPVGTYYVGIGHAYPKELKQTYSLMLK